MEYPSNQIVTGYYYKKVVEIASLTKIMTFFAVHKLLTTYSLDSDAQTVIVHEKAANIGGTSAELC